MFAEMTIDIREEASVFFGISRQPAAAQSFFRKLLLELMKTSNRPKIKIDTIASTQTLHILKV